MAQIIERNPENCRQSSRPFLRPFHHQIPAFHRADNKRNLPKSNFQHFTEPKVVNTPIIKFRSLVEQKLLKTPAIQITSNNLGGVFVCTRKNLTTGSLVPFRSQFSPNSDVAGPSASKPYKGRLFFRLGSSISQTGFSQNICRCNP